MNQNYETKDRRTLVGVLASHDNPEQNNRLADLFNLIAGKESGDRRKTLERFHFVFTGGTYDRLFTTRPHDKDMEGKGLLDEDVEEFLLHNCGVLRLPDRKNGGVTVLACLVVQHKISILWPFLTPLTTHWLNPENLALMRLCDQWHVKRLMNRGSAEEWIDKEAEVDADRNRQDWPFMMVLEGSKKHLDLKAGKPLTLSSPALPATGTSTSSPVDPSKMTIALIAHDEMKERMAEFASDYEAELSRFERVLATGTTGRIVEDAAPSLRNSGKIHKYHSGPKGGDIEIATEILYGCCQAVVFFVDPLHPHPHIEDIRVVFAACMIQDRVRMLSNEMQAREWMERVVRRQTG